MARAKQSIWEGDNLIISISIIVLFLTLLLSVLSVISNKSYETRTQAAEIFCPPPEYECPPGYSCQIEPDYSTPRCVRE